MKPHSEACERNRDPILKVLQRWFVAPGRVLEIGSGTGQHAVHLARHMPHLEWLTTDRDENLAGIAAWIAEAQLPNLHGPVKLDVNDADWPVSEARYAFSANTAHIMSWLEVGQMFAGVAKVLLREGSFCLYGPFNRDGEFTSESNRSFDTMLRRRDPEMGIRDDRAMIELGESNGLTLAAEHAMPANNRLLVWAKEEGRR